MATTVEAIFGAIYLDSGNDLVVLAMAIAMLGLVYE